MFKFSIRCNLQYKLFLFNIFIDEKYIFKEMQFMAIWAMIFGQDGFTA